MYWKMPEPGVGDNTNSTQISNTTTYNVIFYGSFLQFENITNHNVVGVFDFQERTVGTMLFVLGPASGRIIL